MIGSSSFIFFARIATVALRELGQHFFAEQLDRFHDVLVAILPRLHHEDHLIDAGVLEAPEVLAQLIRCADRAAQALLIALIVIEPRAQPALAHRNCDVGRVAALGALVSEFLPHV